MITLITSSLHLFSVSMFNIALVYNMLIFCSGVGWVEFWCCCALPLFSLCDSAGACLLRITVGGSIWATIQFSFLQQQHPRMILIFERWRKRQVQHSSVCEFFVLIMIAQALIRHHAFVTSCYNDMGCRCHLRNGKCSFLSSGVSRDRILSFCVAH